MSNDSVRRIMAEVKEFTALNNSPTTFFFAEPLESDLFEWHFTVRGPPGTPFADGVYHGRIVLPAGYPLKAPEIILLTPNGRFEVGKRICLSVTAHHQETWQPSWGIRTILTALVGFMPSKAEGVGALDYPDEDRCRLARRSWHFQCERCGVRPIEQLVVPEAVSAKFPGAAKPLSDDADASPVAIASSPVVVSPTYSMLTEEGEPSSSTSEANSPVEDPAPQAERTDPPRPADTPDSNVVFEDPSNDAVTRSAPVEPQAVTRAPTDEVMRASTQEPELLYLAYAIAVVIMAVIARRVILLTFE